MANTDLTEVQAYLEDNAELRDALGLQPETSLWIEPLGKGEHNENFVFGPVDASARFVLRINRVPQPFHSNQVAYEFAALKALEPSGCTPRPLFLDHGPAAPGKGVLVESFCAGQELDFDHLRPHDLERAAQLMANIHAVPVADDCPLYSPADPLKALFDECVDRFKAYQGTELEECGHMRWAERFLAATQDAIQMAPAPTAADRGHIINTETLPSHFLLPADADAAAAGSGTTGANAASPGTPLDPARPGTFVDWERPIVAEPAQDLAFFVAPSTTFWDSDYLFPQVNVGDFLETYWRAVDGRFPRGTFDARFAAYLRVSVLRSQTWFCKNAARYEGTAAGHTVQRTFQKWGIYTSDDFNAMLWRECFQ
ncbi:MAG: phosphotransferase [Coriobacteriia bacterium]|nr:phosphotransferase [Coriobacteriia bacterium]